MSGHPGWPDSFRYFMTLLPFRPPPMGGNVVAEGGRDGPVAVVGDLASDPLELRAPDPLASCRCSSAWRPRRNGTRSSDRIRRPGLDHAGEAGSLRPDDARSGLGYPSARQSTGVPRLGNPRQASRLASPMGSTTGVTANPTARLHFRAEEVGHSPLCIGALTPSRKPPDEPGPPMTSGTGDVAPCLRSLLWLGCAGRRP